MYNIENENDTYAGFIERMRKKTHTLAAALARELPLMLLPEKHKSIFELLDSPLFQVNAKPSSPDECNQQCKALNYLSEKLSNWMQEAATLQKNLHSVLKELYKNPAMVDPYTREPFKKPEIFLQYEEYEEAYKSREESVKMLEALERLVDAIVRHAEALPKDRYEEKKALSAMLSFKRSSNYIPEEIYDKYSARVDVLYNSPKTSDLPTHSNDKVEHMQESETTPPARDENEEEKTKKDTNKKGSTRLDKKLFKDPDVAEWEAERFKTFVEENSIEKKLDARMDNELTDAFFCFLKHWKEKGFIIKKEIKADYLRFLKNRCGYQLKEGLGYTTVDSFLGKMVGERRLSHIERKVDEFFKTHTS